LHAGVVFVVFVVVVIRVEVEAELHGRGERLAADLQVLGPGPVVADLGAEALEVVADLDPVALRVLADVAELVEERRLDLAVGEVGPGVAVSAESEMTNCERRSPSRRPRPASCRRSCASPSSWCPFRCHL
jgi:hypothetical protein